jgi:hypothetical protein
VRRAVGSAVADHPNHRAIRDILHACPFAHAPGSSTERRSGWVYPVGARDTALNASTQAVDPSSHAVIVRVVR